MEDPKPLRVATPGEAIGLLEAVRAEIERLERAPGRGGPTLITTARTLPAGAAAMAVTPS